MASPPANTRVFCVTRPEQAVMATPSAVQAHEQQLALVGRRFVEAGWDCTELGIQATSGSRGTHLAGWVRLTDGINELRVNYVWFLQVEGTSFLSRFVVLAKPAQVPPSANDAGLRIIDQSTLNLGTIHGALELSVDNGLDELEFRGAFDIKKMLPDARLRQMLECVEP